jgi:hypothetical protein
MKTKALIAVLTAGMFTSANAFIVLIQSGFDKAVTTTTNVAIPSGTGFVATGFFTTVADVDLINTAPASLATAFQQFGNSGTFGFGGFGGVYQVESAPGRISPGSPFVNKSIYTLLGNGSSVSTSSEFVIFKHNGLFLVDDQDSQDKTYDATLGVDGAFLMGSATGDIINVGGFDFPQVKMVAAVPEPSAALLGALGALGLLRRRRI